MQRWGNKRTSISEEVKKLNDVEFIRNIKYPSWMANVVMVRKAFGKWRMFMKFADLNQAC